MQLQPVVYTGIALEQADTSVHKLLTLVHKTVHRKDVHTKLDDEDKLNLHHRMLQEKKNSSQQMSSQHRKDWQHRYYYYNIVHEEKDPYVVRKNLLHNQFVHKLSSSLQQQQQQPALLLHSDYSFLRTAVVAGSCPVPSPAELMGPKKKLDNQTTT
jgi:hypothetical protein